MVFLDFQPRQKGGVIQRGTRLTHPAAQAGDVLPRLDNGRFQKAVLRRARPHPLVEGQNFARLQHGAVELFRRQGDVVRARRVFRAEIGGEGGEKARLRPRRALGEAGQFFLRLHAHFPHAAFERGFHLFFEPRAV